MPLLFGLCAFILAQPAQPAARPWLGVAVVPADVMSAEGVQIREVTPDSPAARAGLKEGDVVVKVGGKTVADVPEFLRAVGSRKPGEVLALDVQRGGKDMTVKATLGQRPAGEVAGQPNLKELTKPAFLGVQVQELTPELRKQLKVKAQTGAVVAEVIPNSPAAKAGLQTDDVITGVNNKTVKSAADLRGMVQQAGAGKEVTLHIERGGEQKDVKASLRSGPVLFDGIRPAAPDGRLPFDIESMWDDSGRVQKLQQRVDMLEKRVRELEKQLNAKK